MSEYENYAEHVYISDIGDQYIVSINKQAVLMRTFGKTLSPSRECYDHK